MKAMLKISILLNCVLLCGLLFMLAAGRHARSVTPPPAPFDEAESVEVPAVPATALPTKGADRPFNWSQVESSDYGTYMGNLRSIGCPEQTIRDIITADVDSQYAARREPLEQNLTGNAFAERAKLESGLHAMRQEEASLITGLLGAPTTAATTATFPAVSSSGSQAAAGTTSMPLVSQSAAPSAATQVARTTAVPLEATPYAPARKAPPAAISLPLVMQDVDPSMLKLNSRQAQAVNDLREQFIEEVGGPNQDPNDPTYAQRWQSSQPQADLDLRGMIGIRAWEAYQIAAWAKAQEQTPSGP
jgi:hypothetical protein